MFTRRQLFAMFGLTAASFALRTLPAAADTRHGHRQLRFLRSAQDPNHLDPLTIPKFVTPLVIPPVMPPATSAGGVPIYHIAVRQFQQQVLPDGLPPTTVWGYGHADGPLPGQPGSTFNFPAFTIEGRSGQPLKVKWINKLVDNQRRFLPHLLTIDQTLHWANPPGPRDGRTQNPTPYRGPVPIVTHVHGAHVPSVSDGYPEAWYLPDAVDIPAGYYRYGTRYATTADTDPDAAVFAYPNDQRAATLWYHDHTLGITRINVYAGLAGFYILRDAVEDALNLPGPAPRLGDPAGTKYYEIPIVIQDRAFKKDGSLDYPASRADFDDYPGPYIPDSPVSPFWNPEDFPDAIVVNGRTWPYLEVEPRLYRFRLLNGTNSRFLLLKFDRAGLRFTQIGNEGGLLSGAPVVQERLLMAPAERADVLVNFAAFQPGDEITLLNLGPDEPFKGLNPDGSLSDGEGGVLAPAKADTTGRILRFKVVALTQAGNRGQVPVSLPTVAPLTTTLPPRDLTLNEEVYEEADIPIAALLGTAADGPLMWHDPITEKPLLGSTEVWRISNLTMDAHPIHLHLVYFQVLDRIPFNAMAFEMAQKAYLAGGKVGAPPNPTAFATWAPIAPNAWERGWKDTVITNPGQITRVIAKFDVAGLYVWHCHILEHEDNEMMRPFVVEGPNRVYLPQLFRQGAPDHSGH